MPDRASHEDGDLPAHDGREAVRSYLLRVAWRAGFRHGLIGDMDQPSGPAFRRARCAAPTAPAHFRASRAYDGMGVVFPRTVAFGRRDPKLMLRLIGSSLLGLLLAGAAPAHASARQPVRGAQGGPCAATHTHTVLANGTALVYRRGLKYYGCLYARKRPVLLGAARDDIVDIGGLRNFRLAGPFVAFERFLTGKDSLQFRVKVVDLRTSKRRYDTPTGPLPQYRPELPSLIEGTGPTTKIALASSGSVAWIARDTYASSASLQVHKLDRSGPALLDQSSDIDPLLLVIGRGNVSWISARMQRFAPFS